MAKRRAGAFSKLKDLDWRERFLLAEAVVWLGLARLSLLLPFRWLAPRLGEPITETVAGPDVPAAASGGRSSIPLTSSPRIHAISHEPHWALARFYQLEARFDRVDERLVALQVDSRGALTAELINGLQIKLGRGDIEHRIERLVGIYREQILPRREQIERLDLRYSNGFAVAWKKEALQGSDKASIWSNSNV